MIDLLRRSRPRRLLHHRPRPRAPDRPPQGRRRSPDPVRKLLGGLRAPAARRADAASTSTSATPLGVFRLLHRAAADHPHALAHLLRAMDFHFAHGQGGGPGRRPQEGIAWASSRRVVRSQFRPHVVLAGGTEGTETPGADAGAIGGGRPAGRLRLRALRLPAAGHRARGARRRPRLDPGARSRPAGVGLVEEPEAASSAATGWNGASVAGGSSAGCGASSSTRTDVQRPSGGRLRGRPALRGQEREDWEGDDA